MKGYETVKSIIPEISTEQAFSIVFKCANLIKRDRPFEIIGNPTLKNAAYQWMKTGRIENKELDLDISSIDLTGRYRLLAVLLTD